MPNEIFLWNARPLLPGEDEPTADFYGVCSVQEIDTYPVDEPNDDDMPQFFRTSSVHLRFDFYTEAMDWIAGVEDRVQALVGLFNQLDEFVDSQTVEFGDPEEESP